MGHARDELLRPIDRLLRNMEARDRVPAEEAHALAACLDGDEVYAAGSDVVIEGRPERVCRLLVDGMAARVKLFDDGRRQITALHVPGDFLDLHSLLLKSLDHDIVALTPARFATFPHERMRAASEAFPHLGRMLWLLTLIDGAIHRAWIVSAGRRSALEQVASLFCELYVRYDIAGLMENGCYPLKITQQLLADACGLSPVHVNRVVQELREQGLVTWRGGMLTIADFPRLADLARFDPSYLSLTREPR
jgi:CRP-like cAMP-binding protein